MTLVAGGLVARGHSVTLLTLTSTDLDVFAVDRRVVRVALDLSGPEITPIGRARRNIRRIKEIRRAILQSGAHVVVSFITETNILTLLATLGTARRVIVSERVDPRVHAVGRGWTWLRQLTYWRASVLVTQTPNVAAWFRSELLAAPTTVVIPNPVAAEVSYGTGSPDVARPYLLGAGRLVPQKGFDLLIQGFAVLVKRHESIDLVIAGAGAEGERLKRIAAELGIIDRVSFPGYVWDLGKLMAGATAFVLPSRYEGFPNVLLEALARGVPTIAADCLSGPREILQNGAVGILVPPEDPVALADAAERLITDVQLQARLRREGIAVARSFSVEAVTAMWEHAFEARK